MSSENNLSPQFFLTYYSPLAASSLTAMLLHPLASAILFRMNFALESVAVFAGVHYLLGIFKATARAYIEVVIAFWSNAKLKPRLKVFSVCLLLLFLSNLTVIMTTPLFTLWFDEIIALPHSLAPYLRPAMMLYLPSVAVFTLSAYLQGGLIAEGETKTILKASLLILLSFLLTGYLVTKFYSGPGVFAVICCMNIALSVEASFFYWKLRRVAPSFV